MGDTKRIVWCEYEDGNFQHDSLGDLLDYDDSIEVGQTVWFGEAVEPDTDWINADTVIDRIGDAAYDVGGEHAEDFPRVTDEAKAELSTFLREWQAKHCRPTFWTVRNVKSYTVTDEDTSQ